MRLRRDRRNSDARRYLGDPHGEGDITVYDHAVRSMTSCDACGQHPNAGDVSVRHADGRQIEISYLQIHEVEAGHALTFDQAAEFVALMQDANLQGIAAVPIETKPAQLQRSTTRDGP